jgi:hypothetical protein
MMALGAPDGPEMPAEEGSSTSDYLAKKPPKLRAFLMDATDDSLSPIERAEALCRAMEAFWGDEEQDEEEEAPAEEEPAAEDESFPAEY